MPVIATDPAVARYAKKTSLGFASVIFVQQELSKDDNGDSVFSLPMVLPYPIRYFTSVGNAKPYCGYKTVMRVFDASLGYAKLRIQHSFSDSNHGKTYVFATTELCVLDMNFGEEFKTYATQIEDKDKKHPPVTTGYSELGLKLTKDDLDGVDIENTAAYENTIIMTDVRHAVIHHVIDEMARDKVEGFRPIVDVVNSVFSQRRKPLKMTVFVPGFDQRCVRALESLPEAIQRSAMSPYLPLCVKVPDTQKFSHPDQMVSCQELSENTQHENPEVYYQTISEMVVRMSYACRNEHLNVKSVGEWLKNSPQKGIRIPLPFLQIEGQVAAGLIILPAPQGTEAMPAIGEVVQIKVDVKFTLQTPPDAEATEKEICNRLGKQIWDIIQKATEHGGRSSDSTIDNVRVGLDSIAIPGQTKGEVDHRRKWLATFARQCMPQVVDNVQETPVEHNARVQSLVEANCRFFQLRESTHDEAPMLTAVRVVPPRFLRAYGPHCYLTIDPKQSNWPNDGPPVPRVQFSWPDIALESTVEVLNKTAQDALKTKTFNLWLHRICHDETLLTQIRGIHDFAPDSFDNNEFARFARWCLDFGETSEKHDPADFWPALKHLRDRIEGKEFEDCAYAHIPRSEPKTKPAPSQPTPKQPVVDDDQPEVLSVYEFIDDAPKPEDMKSDDIVDGDVPKISRALSELLVKAFNTLDDDQKTVVMAAELSHGVLLVSGCAGSGKSLIGLFMAIISVLTTVDVSRFPSNISSPKTKIEQTVPQADNANSLDNKQPSVSYKKGITVLAADTHDRLGKLAEKVDMMGKEMFQVDFKIVYVTNPAIASSTLHDLLGGKQDIFEDTKRPELDTTTVEYMLYEAGNEFQKDTQSEMRGHRFNISSHIRNMIEDVRKGIVTIPEAMDVSDLMEERKQDPTGFANDKDKVKELKGNIEKLEMLAYNTADFLVGTPVTLGRLAHNKAFTGKITCLMIDEAYRMAEPNMLSLLASFKDTPIRELIGDMRQLAPVVTTLRTGTNPFAMQLSQAMPARMEAAGVVPYALNVNHRAINGCSNFCSKNFYGGAMIEARSRNDSQAEIQHAVGILGSRFDKKFRGASFNFDLHESKEARSGNGYTNEQHAQFIADLCTLLHCKGAARQLPTPDEEGHRASILIQCMYKGQVQAVRAQLRRLRKGSVCMDLIKVSTVDSAQDAEADIAIVDMVRSSDIGFTGEHRRVNVAYSRARFFTITVANYHSVNKTLQGRGNAGIDILSKQHRWAKARNSEVKLSKHQMLSCARCLGRPHRKGKCKAKLECAVCFCTGHHALECLKREHLKPTIPELRAGQT